MKIYLILLLPLLNGLATKLHVQVHCIKIKIDQHYGVLCQIFGSLSISGLLSLYILHRCIFDKWHGCLVKYKWRKFWNFEWLGWTDAAAVYKERMNGASCMLEIRKLCVWFLFVLLDVCTFNPGHYNINKAFRVIAVDFFSKKKQLSLGT